MIGSPFLLVKKLPFLDNPEPRIKKPVLSIHVDYSNPLKKACFSSGKPGKFWRKIHQQKPPGTS